MAWPDTMPVLDADEVEREVPVPKGGIGAPNDAAAGSDTGTATLIALFKRAMGYWRTNAEATAGTDPIPVKGVLYPKSFAFSTDTGALAIGDVAADTQVITDCVPTNDQSVLLQSLRALDKADQASVDLTLIFFSANVSLGTENAAPSITDVNAEDILGHVDILTADWKDFGGVKEAQPNFKPFLLKPAAGTRNVYVALLVKAGTPTFAADSVHVLVGLMA